WFLLVFIRLNSISTRGGTYFENLAFKKTPNAHFGCLHFSSKFGYNPLSPFQKEETDNCVIPFLKGIKVSIFIALISFL
ncbi:hypothetical protein, partial [Streptococcus iniae]|uniref:hypothetical protein n=4 Tax=Streptococcus iniae TaxID=1346 RepID=UPI003D984E48